MSHVWAKQIFEISTGFVIGDSKKTRIDKHVQREIICSHQFKTLILDPPMNWLIRYNVISDKFFQLFTNTFVASVFNKYFSSM